MGVTGVDSPGRTLECLCSGSLRFGDALECAPLLCEEPVTSGDCTLLVGGGGNEVGSGNGLFGISVCVWFVSC